MNVSDPSARESAWRALEAHAAQMAQRSLRSLYEMDARRHETFAYHAPGVLLDLGRQRLTGETFALFAELARATALEARLAAMRAGEKVNTTEGRAALHVALRGMGGDASHRAAVAQARASLRQFVAHVSSGERAGAGGPFNAIVHLGIGGSDLGPRLVLDALKDCRRRDLDVRFAANVDGAEIADALEGLDPARTLVVVVSKTFTTQETLANADFARAWLVDALGDVAARRQIIAVSAATDKAQAWGASTVFPFWDWVGGRYSLWSAVGVTCELAIGSDAFEDMLAGAAAMDAHVFETPSPQNVAFLAACVQSFNRLLGHGSYALVPYARRLSLLPSFLQQLEMESNGKGVDELGAPLARSAAAVTWGEPGTNAQHSFFQLLHQGREVVPVEFLVVMDASAGPVSHRDMLVSNALAQAQALYQGRTQDEARTELLAAGATPERAELISAHRTFKGDRPSSFLALETLSPRTLGALLAFYEHRTVIQAWLAGVNPFDQWGVELGKQMATRLLPALKGEGDLSGLDPATAAWVGRLRRPQT